MRLIVVKTAVFIMLATLVALGAAVAADTPPPAPASDPGEQIKDGATKVGQGIKQGAINLWEATKSAVSAGTDKLNGHGNSPTDGKTPPPPQPQK
jgi:hypothetical protein